MSVACRALDFLSASYASAFHPRETTTPTTLFRNGRPKALYSGRLRRFFRASGTMRDATPFPDGNRSHPDGR
jgi:hypothetical protein